MTESQKDYLKRWAKAAAVRAVKTAAQVAILTIGADAFNVFAIDWVTIIGFAIGGAVLSLLTSLAGLPEVEPERGTE